MRSAIPSGGSHHMMKGGYNEPSRFISSSISTSHSHSNITSRNNNNNRSSLCKSNNKLRNGLLIVLCLLIFLAAISNVFIANQLYSPNDALFARPVTKRDFVRQSTQTTSRMLDRKKSRVLVGIFTTDSISAAVHRKWHRRLIHEVWADGRVCSLHQFRNDPAPKREACELIYTFVAGMSESNVDAEYPTERLSKTDTLETPIEVEKLEHFIKEDINQKDVTRLNIRESMNFGKSQTWFYFGSKISKAFEATTTPIDYVMKHDSDAILFLQKFWEFKNFSLHPFPYNSNIFAGALRIKGEWFYNNKRNKEPVPPDDVKARLEKFWREEFLNVHLYHSGESYIMSSDLAEFVATEALKVAEHDIDYLEFHEDHDIGSMVFRHPLPIQMVSIGLSQKFWVHPVKQRKQFMHLEKQIREQYGLGAINKRIVNNTALARSDLQKKNQIV